MLLIISHFNHLAEAFSSKRLSTSVAWKARFHDDKEVMKLLFVSDVVRANESLKTRRNLILICSPTFVRLTKTSHPIFIFTSLILCSSKGRKEKRKILLLNIFLASLSPSFLPSSQHGNHFSISNQKRKSKNARREKKGNESYLRSYRKKLFSAPFGFEIHKLSRTASN
jgi:hypothetical protein